MVVAEVMHVRAELADCLLRFFVPNSHFFFVHGKHRVCKSHLFSFSVPFYIYLYVFFLLCRLLHNDQNNSGFRQIGRIGNIIGFILALRRPFAE